MTPAQMVYLHRRGYTLDKIAIKSGLSRYQVHRAIVKERWKQGEVVISEVELRKMVKDGLTVRQMADKHLCSIGCIAKKIKKYGVKVRPRGNPNL